MYARFQTTVNLGTFIFGVPVSDVTIEACFFCELITTASGTSETLSRGCAPARATMTELLVSCYNYNH
jgi:hypothetical protein